MPQIARSASLDDTMILRRLSLLALLMSGTMLLIPRAQAATIEAPSKLDAVTLYPDAALVRRVVIVDVPLGSHELIIADLPPNLDPASLRVEGSADAKLAIGSVDLRRTANIPGKGKAENEKRLKGLRLDLDRIRDKIDAVEGRKTMIQRMAQGNAAETPAAGDRPARGLDLDHWSRAWELVGKGLEAANADLRLLRIDEARLDEEITAIEAAMGGKTPANPKHEAIINLEAATAGRATLQISYRVQGASWRPIYDARLVTTTGKPELELTRRAMIRQNTGEDWADAALTLSTISVRRGTAAPNLNGERIAILEPAPPAPRPLAKATPEAGYANMAALAPAPRARSAADLADAAPIEETAAQSETSAFQTQFAVPGKVSLAGNGTEKSVRLGTSKMTPDLQIKAAPLLDPTAYLEAQFRHDGDAPLLPGEVLLHRDGAFIGKGRLPLIPAGEKADLGFGADEQVRIVRIPLSRETREPGLLGSTRSEERSFKLSVKNLHAFALNVTLLDRVPISEDQIIIVERMPEMSKPDQENVDDKRGVIAFKANLKPQDERSYTIAYRIRWPQGKEIRAQPLPGR